MKASITAGEQLRRLAITRTMEHIQQVASGRGGLRRSGLLTYLSREDYLAGERRRLEVLKAVGEEVVR